MLTLAFSKLASPEAALFQKITGHYIRINIAQEIHLPKLHSALMSHRFLQLKVQVLLNKIYSPFLKVGFAVVFTVKTSHEKIHYKHTDTRKKKQIILKIYTAMGKYCSKLLDHSSKVFLWWSSTSLLKCISGINKCSLEYALVFSNINSLQIYTSVQ